MDENVNYTAEAEEIEAGTVSAIDEDWYEGGETEEKTETVEAETRETADQQEPADDAEETEEAQEADGEKPAEKESKEEDQLFELKYMGETRKATREEVTALAQKGMDYDRVRAKYDELKLSADQAARNNQYADFVQELAKQNGITAEELIDQTRARILMSSEKAAGREISADDALARVKKDRESKAPDPAALKQEKQREAVARFMELYPGLESDKIPAEVWAEADKLGDLVGPYQKHVAKTQEDRIAELQRQIDGMKQDRKNEERSTGSRRSAGAQTASQSFDALWYNGD